MKTFCMRYPLTAFPDQLVVQDLFKKELAAVRITSEFDSAEVDGDSVNLWFSTPLQMAELPQLSLVVSQHRASLQVAKDLKYKAIDAKTDAMIARGFTYMDVTLSLSLEAQCSMLALDTLRDDPAVVYPIQFNSIDDTDAIELANSTDIRNMSLVAVGTLRGIIDSGSALKNAVRVATTVAEVEAVVDPRP